MLSFRVIQPSDLNWPIIRSRHFRLLRRFVGANTWKEHSGL
jgi:hypothetical protein